MILVVLLIGAILLVAALRNTYGALFTDLKQDVPGFVVWAAAVVALGAIGFIPGLKPISRGLMALVLVVIVMQNYTKILAGFQSVSKTDNTSSNTAAPNAPPAAGSTVPDYGALDSSEPSYFSSASIGH